MEKTEATPVQKEEVVQQADQPQTQGQPMVTMGVEDFKNFIKDTVKNVIEASRTGEVRQEIEEYNRKISEAVQESQATLIKPERTNNETNLDYVKKVLEEDQRRRKTSYDGKAHYSDKGEDFIKAKIIILKKMGLTDEEIAKEFEN